MFNEAELTVEAEDYLVESDAKAETAETKESKAKPGRKPLPTDLPRIRIEHDLSEADKQCSCGCERTEIGEVTSWTLSRHKPAYW